MLNLMRKHAGSWMIKVVLFAIVVVFVFWGVGSMRSQKATQVADVNGEIITVDVYRQAYYQLMDKYRQIYGSQLNDALLEMLKPNEMALNQLIDRILLMQEARRLDIEVGKEELAQAIASIPAFQNNGVFDYQRYNQILARNNLSPERFEMERSEEMVLNKLRAVVFSGVSVSEDEAKAWYNWSKAKVRIEYMLFSPDRYQDVQPTDEQVQAFFNDHKDNYRTEPKVKARYVRFSPDAYKAEIKISDEHIAEYYNSHPQEFKTQKRVKARHILLKLDEKEDAEAVDRRKTEAMKIYAMAKAGKDFSELAKQYSEGPSKAQGGDLGWFTRDGMVKPFADKAFAMAVNEICEPVRTSFGWHIIKVEQIEEAATRSLEEATEGIRAKLTDEKAKALALEKAEALYDSVFDGDDLAEAGKAHNVPVDETKLFTAKGPGEKGIVQAQKFANIAFGLETMAISEVQDFSNGYYILQVTQKAQAQIPDFDQVADRVVADARKDQQKQRAKADAEALLAEAKAGGTFTELGAQKGIQPKVSDFFARNAPIPQIGYEQQINHAAFLLTTEKPLAQEVLQGGKGWYVIRLQERQAPAEEGFGKEKESIAKRLTEQKRQTTYQNWLAELRSRSEIDVNEKLIQP
ncbi:MAG: SurA N-terminal domain-containing protein [Desulfobacteraceae bacterium]|jgi:peptidyl-prolyl cis-trans isomerase D